MQLCLKGFLFFVSIDPQVPLLLVCKENQDFLKFLNPFIGMHKSHPMSIHSCLAKCSINKDDELLELKHTSFAL